MRLYVLAHGSSTNLAHCLRMCFKTHIWYYRRFSTNDFKVYLRAFLHIHNIRPTLFFHTSTWSLMILLQTVCAVYLCTFFSIDTILHVLLQTIWNLCTCFCCISKMSSLRGFSHFYVFTRCSCTNLVQYTVYVFECFHIWSNKVLLRTFVKYSYVLFVHIYEVESTWFLYCSACSSVVILWTFCAICLCDLLYMYEQIDVFL